VLHPPPAGSWLSKEIDMTNQNIPDQHAPAMQQIHVVRPHYEGNMSGDWEVYDTEREADLRGLDLNFKAGIVHIERVDTDINDPRFDLYV
jgi:hypothetical protein